MPNLFEKLFTARMLSIALVVEVGFIVGIFVGRTPDLVPLQWGGAALALVGAAVFAAIVHSWPEPQPKKAEATRVRQQP